MTEPLPVEHHVRVREVDRQPRIVALGGRAEQERPFGADAKQQARQVARSLVVDALLAQTGAASHHEGSVRIAPRSWRATSRRGRLTVGPLTSIRSDALGLDEVGSDIGWVLPVDLDAAGIKKLRSVNLESVSQIIVEFELNINADQAAQDMDLLTNLPKNGAFAAETAFNSDLASVADLVGAVLFTTLLVTGANSPKPGRIKALPERVDIRQVAVDERRVDGPADGVPLRRPTDAASGRGVSGPSVEHPGSRSRAACRCRSGAASKVNRNAAGAVSDTAIPCGTIGSPCG